MRLLIADRDPTFITHINEMVSAAHFADVTVDHVTTVDDALSALQNTYYDLCFLEYRLDGAATGLQVLKSLQAPNVLTAFVFLTDHANREAAYEALTLGAMDYLIKQRFTAFEFAKCISYSMYLKHREIQTQRESLRDSLTGLGNKGLFSAQMEQSSKRAARDKETLGLLIIDVDGFKAVNDKYGHQVGDQLLQQISERIVNETRASDVVARIGGDEFAAILIKPKSSEHIYTVGNKLEKAIASMPYNLSGTIVKIGASVGCSVLPDDSSDLKELFTLADKRMYKNKNIKKSGRIHARDYMDQILN
jgi:diguanylate cyclase (GGDEF)-like protein